MTRTQWAVEVVGSPFRPEVVEADTAEAAIAEYVAGVSVQSIADAKGRVTVARLGERTTYLGTLAGDQLSVTQQDD